MVHTAGLRPLQSVSFHCLSQPSAVGQASPCFPQTHVDATGWSVAPACCAFTSLVVLGQKSGGFHGSPPLGSASGAPHDCTCSLSLVGCSHALWGSPPLHCVCSEPAMPRTCLAPTTSSVPAQCSRPHFLWLCSSSPPRQVMLPMGAALSLLLTQPLGLSTWYCGGICPPALYLPVGSWKTVPDFHVTSSPS